MKNLSMCCSNVVYYARAGLPSIMPNLETLDLRSDDEVVDTPMLPTKFHYLNHLTICMRSGTFNPSYDYFSVVSFLDASASPSLETLILDVSKEHMERDSVFGDSSHLRQIAEHRHYYLKNVKIIGFSSAKRLIELTCYILNNAVSLECLTLDTLYGFRCSDDEIYERCSPWARIF
uniref:At1g61320/AtMIF1 LRR domain-containing protein n=1 Tax=Arundo donax TaxID=35708 RepID=A0A0A9DSI0_ARUDO